LPLEKIRFLKATHIPTLHQILRICQCMCASAPELCAEVGDGMKG
jgi:hypothetical protein